MQEYERTLRQLRMMLDHSQKVDKELEALEDKLANEEDLYLQESSAGNIVKGFDHYTKSNQNRRRSNLTANDRIFSRSSLRTNELAEDDNA